MIGTHIIFGKILEKYNQDIFENKPWISLTDIYSNDFFIHHILTIHLNV
jgi:hypothetical protein